MPAPTGTWQPDGNAAGIARTRVAWPKSSTIVPARTSRAHDGVRSVRRGGRGGRACRRDRGDAHGGATRSTSVCPGREAEFGVRRRATALPRDEPARELVPFVAAGAGGVRAGGSEERLAARLARRLAVADAGG